MPATAAPTRILIHGASGRMGAALLRLQRDQPNTQLTAAISRQGGTSAHGDILLPTTQMTQADAFDVAIDFSLPEAFDAILDLCLQRRAAFVSGTTGLDADQRARLDAASHRIPVLWAANFSIGVAVLGDLVQRAAAALRTWDCDIIEAHHIHKKDAPSGTALHLGAQVEGGRGAQPSYASLRAGDIVGEHTVQFTTAGERIELIHRATNRDIFARGALQAARALASRPAGHYTLIDLLMPR